MQLSDSCEEMELFHQIFMTFEINLIYLWMFCTFVSSDINGDQKEKDKEKEKEKELELAYDPFGSVDPMNAFLGPRLWDESMMLGDKDLKFEFMDIDEFLDEHGLLGSNSTTEKKPTEEQTKEKSTNDAEPQVDAVVAPQTEATKTDVRLPVSPQEVIPLSIANQTGEFMKHASLVQKM